MAFEEEDDSPAVDFNDERPEKPGQPDNRAPPSADFTSDSDRSSGLGDFGEPVAQDAPAQGLTGGPGNIVQQILQFGRKLSGFGDSPQQQEINQAQDAQSKFAGSLLTADDGPGDALHGGEDMFADAPESDGNIEDRRGQKYESNTSKLMKLGGAGRNFAAGGLVEEEDDAESPAVDLEQAADPAQAAPGAGDVQAPTDGGTTGQGQPPGMVDQFKQAVNTLPRPGDKPSPDEQPGLGQRIQGGVQSFMRYLTGADASPSEHVTQLERQVDPQGALDEDTRKMMALEAAQKQGGDEAAWGTLQHYRQKYDRYRGFAAAALKAGNLPSATKAATQAYSNLLDGNTVLFTPAADGGVLASISRPRGRGVNTLSKTMDVSSTVSLSPQQFQEWLTGMAGQYDNAIENGGPKALQQLVAGQTQQTPPHPQPAQSITGNPAGPGVSAEAPPPRQNFIPTGQRDSGASAPQTSELPAQGGDDRPFAAKGVGKPGQYRELPSNYRSPKNAAEEFPDDPQAKAMAERLHPGDPQAQAGSAYQQGQQKQRNEIDMAKAKKEYEVSKATITGQSRVDAQAVRGESSVRRAEVVNKGKMAVELAKLQNSTQNAHEKNVYKLIGDTIKTLPFGVTGEQASKVLDDTLKKHGIDPAGVRKVPALQDIYGGEGEQAPAAPQGPAPTTQVQQQKFTPPKGQGWQYNSSLKQYRDKQGNMYDANGKRVQ